MFPDFSASLWKRAILINISKTEVLLEVFSRAMISTAEYFQETAKEVRVIWQGEKQKVLFLSSERPVVITTVKKKADYWLISFPPAIFLSLYTLVWFTKKSEKPSTTVGLRIRKGKAIFVQSEAYGRESYQEFSMLFW